MNGLQFGIFAVLQIIIIIMLWIIIDDLGDTTRAVKSMDRNTATFFNDMDKRRRPPWPVVIEPRQQ